MWAPTRGPEPEAASWRLTSCSAHPAKPRATRAFAARCPIPAGLCSAQVSRAHFCIASSVLLKLTYTTNLRLRRPEPLLHPQIPWLPLTALYDEVVIAPIIAVCPLLPQALASLCPGPRVQGPGSRLQKKCVHAVSHTHPRLCIPPLESQRYLWRTPGVVERE